MCARICILEIVLLSAVAARDPQEAIPPHFRSINYDSTTCEKFEQGAFFDPHAVVDSLWKIFYFWSKDIEMTPILFSLPTEEMLKDFGKDIEKEYPDQQINWKNSTLFMFPKPGIKILLVSLSSVGSFQAFIRADQGQAFALRSPHLHITYVRMKIIDRFLGVMNCDDKSAFVLARADEVPSTQEECENAAAPFGFNMEKGRSYISRKKGPDEL